MCIVVVCAHELFKKKIFVWFVCLSCCCLFGGDAKKISSVCSLLAEEKLESNRRRFQRIPPGASCKSDSVLCLLTVLLCWSEYQKVLALLVAQDCACVVPSSTRTTNIRVRFPQPGGQFRDPMSHSKQDFALSTVSSLVHCICVFVTAGQEGRRAITINTHSFSIHFVLSCSDFFKPKTTQLLGATVRLWSNLIGLVG